MKKGPGDSPLGSDIPGAAGGPKFKYFQISLNMAIMALLLSCAHIAYAIERTL
jgi:hypothetical protein